MANPNANSNIKTFPDKVKDYVIGNAWTSFVEIQRLIPDSLLFGSLFLFLLTKNQVFIIFTLFFLEVTASHSLLNYFYKLFYGDSPVKTEASCLSGFRTPRLAVERILMADKYPSLGMFSVSAIASYLISSMLAFKETLDTMGESWKMRYWVSVGLTIAFLILFMLGRMISGCDTGTEILLALVFGSFFGFIFYLINSSVFGIESVNFLGLPYLVNKDTDKSQPIYVCTK
jgi:hypothetical protein